MPAGRGARCGDFSTGVVWSLDERALHINCLELLAGSFAMRCWTRDRAKSCVLLKMDNVLAAHYVNHLGGLRSHALANLAKNFWTCLSHHISVTAEYLLGQANQVADWHSRHLRDSSLWKLDELVFRWLANLWGSIHGGPFCLPSGSPDPTVLQLEAGSASGGDGRLPPGLNIREVVRVSAFPDDWVGGVPDPPPVGGSCDGDTILEVPSLVSSSSGTFLGFSNLTPPFFPHLLLNPSGMHNQLSLQGLSAS